MAAEIVVMVLLVTVLSTGTPSVFASREVLQLNGIPGLNTIGEALTGQTVTLVDVPGLRITSRTEPPTGAFDLGAILSGKNPPPTVYISDKIEGTWLNPITFTSTTELPTNFRTSFFPFTGATLAAADNNDHDDDIDVDIPDVDISRSSKLSTTVHTLLPNFSFPGFNIPLPRFTLPFTGHAPSPRPSATSPNFSFPGFNISLPRFTFPFRAPPLSPPAFSPHSSPPNFSFPVFNFSLPRLPLPFRAPPLSPPPAFSPHSSPPNIFFPGFNFSLPRLPLPFRAPPPPAATSPQPRSPRSSSPPARSNADSPRSSSPPPRSNADSPRSPSPPPRRLGANSTTVTVHALFPNISFPGFNFTLPRFPFPKRAPSPPPRHETSPPPPRRSDADSPSRSHSTPVTSIIQSLLPNISFPDVNLPSPKLPFGTPAPSPSHGFSPLSSPPPAATSSPSPRRSNADSPSSSPPPPRRSGANSTTVTVHTLVPNFSSPGFNFTLPKFPFPFSAQAPPPPPRRSHADSPRSSPPRKKTSSPPPPRRSGANSTTVTVHALVPNFSIPGFNFTLPKFPFPFSAQAPSPPPPRRWHADSPRSPPPPRSKTSSPPPRRSEADSPKSSDSNVRS